MSLRLCGDNYGYCGVFFFFSSRRRHTRCSRDWSSDVCSSDLAVELALVEPEPEVVPEPVVEQEPPPPVIEDEEADRKSVV